MMLGIPPGEGRQRIRDEMFAESYDDYLAPEILARTGASHHRSAVKQGILAAVSELLRFAR